MPVTTAPLNVFFNSDVGLSDVFVIATVGPDTLALLWDELDVYDQAELDAFVDAYGGVNPIPATAGYQTIDFNGTLVGGDPTALDPTVIYHTTIIVDGTPIAVDVDGSVATTFTNLIAELNTDLGANATAAIVGGNIVITSALIGSGSSVEVDDYAAHNLFRQIKFITIEGRQISAFEKIHAPVLGCADTLEALKLYRTNGNTSDLTLFHKYSGSNTAMQLVPPKPKVSDYAGSNAIYWDGTNWLYVATDNPAP